MLHVSWFQALSQHLCNNLAPGLWTATPACLGVSQRPDDSRNRLSDPGGVHLAYSLKELPADTQQQTAQGLENFMGAKHKREVILFVSWCMCEYEKDISQILTLK